MAKIIVMDKFRLRKYYSHEVGKDLGNEFVTCRPLKSKLLPVDFLFFVPDFRYVDSVR